MGSMTRLEIITEGLLQAGVARASRPSRAVTWLSTWLKSQYRAWPWPYLLQSREALALPAGTTSLKVGSGSGGISDEIARVLSPIWVYDSSLGTRLKAPIIQVGSFKYDENEALRGTARGLPGKFKVRTARVGELVNFQLIPFPIPDRDYLLQFNYIGIPVDPCEEDTSVPLYPNDQTMIQAVKAKALLDLNGEDDPQAVRAETKCNDMAIADRVKDGSTPGINDMVGLDDSVYR